MQSCALVFDCVGATPDQMERGKVDGMFPFLDLVDIVPYPVENVNVIFRYFLFFFCNFLALSLTDC